MSTFMSSVAAAAAAAAAAAVVVEHDDDDDAAAYDTRWDSKHSTEKHKQLVTRRHLFARFFQTGAASSRVVCVFQ